MTVEGVEEIVVEAGNEVELPECSPVKNFQRLWDAHQSKVQSESVEAPVDRVCTCSVQSTSCACPVESVIVVLGDSLCRFPWLPISNGTLFLPEQLVTSPTYVCAHHDDSPTHKARYKFNSHMSSCSCFSTLVNSIAASSKLLLPQTQHSRPWMAEYF